MLVFRKKDLTIPNRYRHYFVYTYIRSFNSRRSLVDKNSHPEVLKIVFKDFWAWNFSIRVEEKEYGGLLSFFNEIDKP